ncbi:MAG TPA: hypothetical protein VFE16_07715 [Candidatus Cybelea sp.]|nr:hypothetical protein [Candidatus Cybelea sp.]
MNKTFAAIAALVIALIAFALGYMRPFADVNPVGFHARGQVQINGKNTLNASNCTTTSKKPCTFTFHFSLDDKSTPAVSQSCDAGTNCVSFSNAPNQMFEVETDSAGTGTQYHEYVNARIVVSQ